MKLIFGVSFSLSLSLLTDFLFIGSQSNINYFDDSKSMTYIPSNTSFDVEYNGDVISGYLSTDIVQVSQANYI